MLAEEDQRRGRNLGAMEEGQQGAHRVSLFNRVPQRSVRMNDVVVAATDPLGSDIAFRLQVRYDPLRSAFRYADFLCHVAKTDFRISGEAKQDVGVIG